jgi:hypothetical protein
MKRFFAFLIIVLIAFSGCLQQKPEEIKDQLVINPSDTGVKVPEKMQYLSKGEFAQGPLLVKATYYNAYLLENYSYFEPDANEDYYYEPQEGYYFLVINARLENFNEQSVLTGANDFSLADKDGYRFYPKIFYSEKTMPMIGTLEFKNKFSGEMLFEIPKTKTNLIFQYLLAPNYAWQVNANSLVTK